MDGWRVYRRAELPRAVLLEAVRRHDEALRSGRAELLKQDHRARVTRVELDVEGERRSLAVKEYLRPRFGSRLDRALGSRARLAWRGSQACRVRGVGTPQALGIVETGERSFFVSAFVEGAVSFDDYVADFGRPRDPAARARWLAFVDAAADFVRHLHDQRLRHHDLASKNLLVRERSGGFELLLTDVGDVSVGRRPSLRYRIRNLGQLAQLKVNPSRSDRLRFFRRYAAGRPELERPELLREIDALARARHERWLERGGREILEERRRQGRPV